MKTNISINDKDLKSIHFELLEWKSNLHFIQGEVKFINQLLQSYVFEPNTPNLFERLDEFRLKIENVEKGVKKFYKEIGIHESELGGMLECDTVSCDHYYYDEHKVLKKNFDNFYKSFRKLKLEVFGYAGGILKNNKNAN